MDATNNLMPSSEPKRSMTKATELTITKSRPVTLGRMLVENIESLGAAIIMALVLKYFLVEAYKIPTGSMQPTIMGTEQVSDRVLVNKFIYLVSQPERFDVIVFKWPFDHSINYIKRLIGLPGEKVQIRNGDVFVATADDPSAGLKPTSQLNIVRKDRSAREAVMKRVYPGVDAPNGISPDTPLNQAFPTSINVKFEGADQARVDVGTTARLIYAPQDTGRYKELRGGVRDDPWHGYDPKLIPDDQPGYLHDAFWVGDLKIACTLKPVANGTVGAQIDEAGRRHHFALAVGDAGESYLSTSDPDQNGGTEQRVVLANVRLAPGKSYDLAFMNIDDTMIVELDGSEVGRLEYQTRDAMDKIERNHVEVFVEQCGASLHDVEVARDIYYLASASGASEWKSRVWEIPAAHYFALGDNTQNSSDSREWREQTLELKDGRKLRGAFAPQRGNESNPRMLGGGNIRFHDENAEDWVLKTSDIKSNWSSDYKEQPFIPAELMLGKAFFVFWPVWPFAPTVRWKLIH